MGDHRNVYREEVLKGTAYPPNLAKGLRGSLQVLHAKAVNGTSLTADLHTDKVTTAAGGHHPNHPGGMGGPLEVCCQRGDGRGTTE